MKTAYPFLRYIFLIVFTLSFSLSGKTQTYLYEDFESGEKPAGWSYIKYNTSEDWQYLDGGFSTTGNPGTGKPPYAKEGYYNAMFHLESFSGQRVKLVPPPLDLEFAIKPELAFWHAQNERFTQEQWRNDELRVFYKEHEDSSWKQIAEYTNKVSTWTERIVQLPDSVLSSTFYVAFEGKTNNGYGVCIDSIAIVEKGIIPRYIESVDVAQASGDFVATESIDNPILRVDISVKGNEGQIVLDSLVVHSLNTNDADLSNNGVKLYASDDELFYNSYLIKSGTNFIDGKATFTNINRNLPTGLSTLWVTYDIDEDVDHEKHEHILDAKILANHIKINNGYYPIVDKSPEGERVLYESIFHDDFETDKGWEFTGEFEWGIPQGKGGITKGAPDPEVAVSGEKIIGTDLSGLGDSEGDYEHNLTDRADQATSPYVNAKYYNDTYLYYHRWFNMDSYDSASVDLNTEKADNWERFWKNSGTSINNQWYQVKYNTNNAISRKDSIRVRFTLGPTNDFWNYSGWNIDNVTIVGNYIGRDVAVTEWIAPFGGCGLTEEELVTVKIKNFAGEPMDESLPVSFSFDGGTTIYYDTIYTTIPVDDSLIHTFNKPVDLTSPGWYNNVYATTHLAGDEDQSNNRFDTTLFITPTYTLPYTQNFETNYGYYLTGGTNSTWEYGTPDGFLIDNAASGTKAWVTNLDGDYAHNELSYLESPCFNFGGTDSIIFEFKCKGLSEDQTDGLTILYSFDEGETWDPLPNDQDYYWNWYNEENISTLGMPGIDSTQGKWLTYRQLLPDEFSNQSLVKFRFMFASNEISSNEGFGVDDIKIYEAPNDVGVRSLNYPYDDCEWNDTTHVKVYIKNYGPTAVKVGSNIPLVMKFNNHTLRDTLTLLEDLAVEDEILFTFDSTVNMSNAGEYNFTLYTKMESNPFLYSESCNDSLVSTASVLGMPNYNPFPNVIGKEPPINFTLDAGEESSGVDYTSYAWSNSESTREITVDSEGLYHVTVTNSEGCTASDTVEVVNSQIDLTMTQVYTELEDSCEREDLTELSVQVTNNSLKDLEPATDSVSLAYQINDDTIVSETFTLSSTFTMGSTRDFTFTQWADFREVDDFVLKVFTNAPDDLNQNDDTLTFTFSTKGYVDISFALDTIYSSQADTLYLSPSPSYDNYTWSTGETTDTITPTDNISRWYKVTVSDNFVCSSDTDSVYVETYDMAIVQLNSPETRCEDNLAGSTEINVRIKNLSGNTYDATTPVTFRYNFNGEGWSEITREIGTTLSPDQETDLYLSDIDRLNPGDYHVEVFLKSSFDANHSNDSVSLEFETHPLPFVELAYDTIFTTQADTVVLEATPGNDYYLWNTGDETETLEISDEQSRKYIVSVEDMHGCGIDKDSTQIITYDLGISDIIFPKNACSHNTKENVIVTIKNYSKDTLRPGDIINLAYKINESPIVRDSLTLDDYLFPSYTKNYIFSTQADLSEIGIYYINAFTEFQLDAKNSNDTLYDARMTYGFPTIEIGDDIYTTQPDTVQIIAEPGFINYKWNNGVEDDTLNITYPASYEYILTATNINGCSASDSLTVYTYNVKASSLVAPANQCELTDAEEITVAVKNNSMDTLAGDEIISVSYTINNGSPVNETFTLTETLYPDQTVNHTFAQPEDLSVNQVYQFELFAKLADIDVDLYDTTLTAVEFLKPDFDLGSDVFVEAEEYIIDAGAEYTSYLWFDGSTAQTYTVDINNQNPNQYYAVTVTNSGGCEATDSVKVTFNLSPDIAVTHMYSPEETCWVDGESQLVEIEITNAGAVNITSGSELQVGYRIANETPFTESYFLSADLAASESINYTFSQEIEFPEGDDYLIKTFAKLPIDESPANDTLERIVNISSPDVSLSPDDTIYFSNQVTLNAGNWESYLWQDGSTNQTLLVTTEGLYSVTVTDYMGCQGSDEVYCAKTTGIDNVILADDYKITYFPNPVSEELQIIINAQRTLDIRLDLINTHGQVVYNQKLSRVRDIVEKIEVNSYAQGVYYLRFRIDEEFYVRKIIIQ